MRNKITVLLIGVIITVIRLSAQNSENVFRIVGYYSIRSAMDDYGNFPFKKLTHVNLYFLNPDSLGYFTRDLSGLKGFIDKAHRKNVKVLFSIAGGGTHPYYHDLLKEDKRVFFIGNLMEQVLKYNVDGIDVDIEGSDIDENYEAFVTELAIALKQQNKLITSAVAVYYKDQLTDHALAAYDFLNIMVYDWTGPWRPAQPGHHSTYDDAVEDLEYFGNIRNIPKEKLVLGVPFYGYGFASDASVPVKTMNYRQIIASYPGSATADQWEIENGMTMYYNGLPTIISKTRLAKERASGIMIWQLGGDAKGSNSLLKAIWKSSRKN